MKKSLIVFITMFIAASTLVAQKFEVKKIDFDHVKEVTENPNSIYFFPKLLKSYTNFRDTTMSIEACRNFYYGYTFQEDYNPFRESVFSEKVERLYYKETLETAECDSIEFYAEKSLQDNLFDMNQMKFYIYALKNRKKYTMASHRQFKLDRLIAAIMSSGKGTKEEPWVVISPEHEYNIINFLGYVATNHEEVGDGLEYISVQPKEGKSVKGFYFDVRRMMEVAAIKFPDM